MRGGNGDGFRESDFHCTLTPISDVTLGDERQIPRTPIRVSRTKELTGEEHELASISTDPGM
jgi:hypothetical protein